MLREQEVALQQIDAIRKQAARSLTEFLESGFVGSTDEVIFSKTVEAFVQFCGVSAEELAEEWAMQPATVRRYMQDGAHCPINMRPYRLGLILTRLKGRTNNVVYLNSP